MGLKSFIIFTISLATLFLAGLSDDVQGKPAAAPIPVMKPKNVTPLAEEAKKPPVVPITKPEDLGKDKKSEPKEATKKEPEPSPIKEKAKPAPKNIKYFIKTAPFRGGVTLKTPWKSKTGAAVFSRGNRLWIAFSQPLPKTAKYMAQRLPSYIKTSRVINSKNSGVLLLETAFPVHVSTKRSSSASAKGSTWNISLSKRQRLNLTPLEVHISPTSSIPAHIFIPTTESTAPIKLTDPDSGDLLHIIPLHSNGRAIFPKRDFIDLTLLGTAQGIAATAKNSTLKTIRLKTGIRFTKPDGLTVSSNLPELNVKEKLSKQKNLNTFFPYKKWRAVDYEDFISKKHALEKEISRLDNKRSLFPQNTLVELYLSEGMHAEALGLLNRIRKQDANFYAEYQLAALHGAANFMMYRFNEAAVDFADKSIVKEEEIKFWQHATNILLGRTKQGFKYPYFDKLYAKNYPPTMRRRLAIVAADSALANKAPIDAKRIIDLLAADKALNPIMEYAQYIMGRVYIAQDDLGRARAYLTPLAHDSSDRFIRAHAAFTLHSALFQKKFLSRMDFIKELERIRILWRGDSLELNLLLVLGELYVAEEEFIKGLRIWKEILTHYPGTADASTVAAKMADTFLTLFNGGATDDMKPLEALTLYYEFRELTPIGKAGDQMIRNLADRLTSIDLLDRAAALLNHQVKYRLEGEDRSRIGARLALIHILNKQPKVALETLQLTGYGNNKPSLQRNRNHLAARAYADVGEIDAALGVVEGDYSTQAKMIRLDIHWEDKNWENVITTAEDILAARQDITAPLNEEEAAVLLQLGVAYTFENDHTQLQYLRDYFTPLMETSPSKDSFLFITDDRGAINHRNIAKLSEDLKKISSFVKGYRKKIKEEGLSKAIE